MEQELKKHLKTIEPFQEHYTYWKYNEDVNEDSLSDAWLDSGTSYIYKVGVLTAMDSNKLDWCFIVIGTQRSKNSPVQIIGVLHFEQGENDDMGRVIKRVCQMLSFSHPVFDDIV